MMMMMMMMFFLSLPYTKTFLHYLSAFVYVIVYIGDSVSPQHHIPPEMFGIQSYQL